MLGSSLVRAKTPFRALFARGYAYGSRNNYENSNNKYQDRKPYGQKDGSFSRGGYNQRNNYNDNNNQRQHRNDWGNGDNHRGGFNRNRQGNFRNNNFRNDRRGPRKDSKEDLSLIGRNAHKKRHDDGLRGMEDYELDKEATKNLKWEDLVPEGEQEDKAGMSSVPTQRLADLRVLSLPLVNSLIHNRGFDRLTPVQAQTLLPILRNESVVVRAKTGTGKTAAFSIPTIQKVLEAHKAGINQGKVKAVIISPTRELTQQIADEISKILEYGGLQDITVQAFVGGLSRDAQLRQGGFMRGGTPCDILVATPGRLLDIMDEESVMTALDSLVFKVFDEADRLLDIGFERILAQIRNRLTEATDPSHEVPLLLFSATADSNVRNLAFDEFGSRVKVIDTIPKNEPTANELVDQSAVLCPNWADIYEGATRQVVTEYEAAQQEGKNFKTIVFMPTVAMVDNFERILRHSFPRDSSIRRFVMALHGQKSQASRQTRADIFRKEDNAILITTDVVARGMDFPLVTNVIQLGPPLDVSSYVHRIGRTARIGNRGKSALYLVNDVRGYLDSLRRENIRPELTNFVPDENFSEEFTSTVRNSLGDENEEPAAIINSLMSYMTAMRSKFPINSRQFMEGMNKFGELYGLEKLPLTSSNYQSWHGRSRYESQNRRSGSSRKTRMRW